MRDILAPDLRVLFIGFNPGLRSGSSGHHYAGRGNQFWRRLHAAGLTPVLLEPSEDRELLCYAIGSTNLVSGQRERPSWRAPSCGLVRRACARWCRSAGRG